MFLRFSKNTNFVSIVTKVALPIFITFVAMASANAQEICSRAFNGGSIAMDTIATVVPFQSAAIQNTALPSTTEILEYLWVKTTDSDAVNGFNANFDIITNTNSSSYTPAPIVQTTWYRRLARYAGCADYNAESNWVRVTVVANATPIIIAPRQITLGQTTTLATAGGVAYRWSNGHTSPSIEVVPVATTVYSVTITLENGQNVTLNTRLQVVQNLQTNVAYTDENSADTNAARSMTTTEKTASASRIAVFPNPNSTNAITLNWQNDRTETTSIKIMDAAGKIMQTTQINANEGENQYTEDLNILAAGVYFILITNEKQAFAPQRFVKL